MSYKIIIKRQANRMLMRLNPMVRIRITEKIELLGENPDNPILDIKPLKGQKFYRLRVGDWRVIFDLQDKVKIIKIEKIKARGGAYK